MNFSVELKELAFRSLSKNVFVKPFERLEKMEVRNIDKKNIIVYLFDKSQLVCISILPLDSLSSFFDDIKRDFHKHSFLIF